jgi:phosphoserine phosphatase RsbU/P
MMPSLAELRNSLPLILIADDDQIARKILRHTLAQSSYQIIEAKDGQQCLEAFLQYQPDIVILDGNMPVMDGFTCCQKLRNLPEGQHIPILMITGLNDKASIKQAFAVGTTDYITKPINPIVVVHRLQRMYEASQTNTMLRISEKQHRILLNSLKEVIFKTTPEGKLAFLNTAWVNVTGFTVEESLGKSFFDFIYPSDRLRYVNRVIQHSQKSDSHSQSILRLRRSDRQISWVEVFSCRIFSDDGKYQGISGHLVDITEQRQREQYRQVIHTTTRLLSEATDLQITIQRWIQVVCGYFNWDAGVLWQLNKQHTEFSCAGVWHRRASELTPFAKLAKTHVYKLDLGWINQLQFELEPAKTMKQLSQAIGFSEGLFDLALSTSTVIKTEGQLLGIMTFFSHNSQSIEQEFCKFIDGLGTQFAQFICRKQVEAELHRQNILLQSQLQQASEYVRSLLPITMVDRVTIRSQFVPSMQLGGDAFDYYWLDDHRLVIYLLDVAGHGIKSALLSVSVINILRSRALANTQFDSPRSVLTSLNQFFQMSDTGDDYFTIWYGVYDYQTNQLVYSSAGHPPALLLCTNDQAVEVQALESDGIAIGMFSNFDFEDKTVDLQPGDRLFLFSDGVYEIHQPNGEIWGIHSLIELLKIYQQNSKEHLSDLFQKIQSVSAHQPLEDDFSIVEMQIH